GTGAEDPQYVPSMLWTMFVSRLTGDTVVEIPRLQRLLDRCVRHDVRVTVPGREVQAVPAEVAGENDARVWFLQRERPRIDRSELAVLAEPGERAGLRPDLQEEVVRFIEAISAVRRIAVGCEVLLPRSAYESCDQAALRD